MVKTYSYSKDKNIVLTKHFKVGEFKSYNATTKVLTTDKILIDESLPIMLERLYEYLDNLYGLKYIILTSGYRSSDFEKYLSGYTTGYHVKGMAADIMCYKKDGSLINSKEVSCAAETIGFLGIGYMRNATHVDVRENKSFFDEVTGKTGISSFCNYFNITKPSIKYLKNSTYKGVSIVDALKEIKVDSSYAYRKKLALENGINDYKGTAKQNTELLNLLKNGNLKEA